MRYWLLLITLISTMGWGQVTTYNFYNGTAAETFTLPLPCPSTTAGNCHNSGTQNNQASTGANSIWAECQFSALVSPTNPECTGGIIVPSSSSAAGAHSSYVHIARATDYTTGGLNAPVWAGSVGGNASDNMWSSDATRVVIAGIEGASFPFTFDPNPASPTYMQTSKLYGGFSLVGQTVAFSKITPKLMYMAQIAQNVPGLAGTHGVNAGDLVIVSYDFTSTSTAPTVSSGINLIADLNDTCTTVTFPSCTGSNNCSTTTMSVSDDDNTFATGLNGNNGQDNYGQVFVYNRTLGCTEYDTTTGVVHHFDGTTGTVVNANGVTGTSWPPEAYEHEVQIYHDGGKVAIQIEACVSGNNCDAASGATTGSTWTWETGVAYTGNASPTGLNLYPQLVAQDGSYYGHTIQGYTLWTSQVDTSSANRAEWFLRPFTAANRTSVSVDTAAYTPQTCYTTSGVVYGGGCPFIDSHSSWMNNQNPVDNAPIFANTLGNEAVSSTNHLQNDVPSFPVEDELMIIPTTCYPSSCGSTVRPWRYAHNFSTPEPTHGASFYDTFLAYGASSTPVYGQYFVLFTSNWEGQLGCPNGTFSTGPWGASCTGGQGSPYANERADAFIASVPIAVSVVSLTPSTVNFGNQALEITSSPQSVILANSQTTTLTGIIVSIIGANASDFAQTNNCGTQLTANSSCTVNLTFTPTGVGTRTGTLTVTDSTGTQSSSLSGTGVANVFLTPSSVNFGNQGYGTASSPQPVTLANGQTSSLTGIGVSISGTNASDFAQTNNCGTSLAGNSNCTINVTFTPSAYGSRGATLSVSDSAGTQTSSLNGTGTNITAPTTQITAPANNATVSGTMTVTATATDNVGVTSVQIYVDGALASSGPSSPLNYSWNTTTAANGSHTIYSMAYDAAGNAGTSTTVTVTVNNGVVQLLNNPSFETGNFAYWSATGAYLPFVTTAQKYVGKYSAQLGASSAPEPVSDSALYQTVTIPSTATMANLYFEYWGATADVLRNDWQEAQIQDASGHTLAQVMKICTNTQKWTLVGYDLLPFKGQTVRIYFNTHQNGNNKLTHMFIDYVVLYVQ